MNESLPLSELISRFPSEWLLISHPVLDSLGQLSGGIVEFHSKDRDEVYRKATELKLDKVAFWSTGKIPANTAIIL